MSDLQNICEGIAANLATLRTNDPNFIKQVHPFPLASPTPPSLMVHGPTEGGIEYTAFHGPDVEASMRYLIAVEAWLGLAEKQSAHRALRALLSPNADTSLVAAVEAAGGVRARLTARLNADGELSEDQDPACDTIAFEEYRGHSNFVAENGTVYLLATWVFEVLT